MSQENYGIRSLACLRNLGLATAGLAVLVATSAHAEIPCGSTIGPGEKIKLDGNIGPCTKATGGITLIGPATLDLNGHAVTCLVGPDPDAVPVGIRVLGEKARIKNGNVLACNVGIELEGEGRHKVIGVTAALNHEHGFGVTSERNVLQKNESLQNRAGFSIYAFKSTFKKNRAVDNAYQGFRVSGSGHKFVRNEALGNALGIEAGEHGYGAPTRFIRNIAIGNRVVDLSAEDPTCSQDIWLRNEYGTALPACLG